MQHGIWIENKKQYSLKENIALKLEQQKIYLDSDKLLTCLVKEDFLLAALFL